MTLSWHDWQAPAYPGRLIAVGRDKHEALVIVYLITGRSPSSQARRIIEEAGALRTDVTDPQILAQGNPQLLLYECVLRHNDHLLISNGAQTMALLDAAEDQYNQRLPMDPLQILIDAHQRPFWVEDTRDGHFLDLAEYEPDPPHWTPRICAAVGPQHAAMSIVKRVGEETCKNFYSLPLQSGVFNIITTYAGEMVGPGQAIPSFAGEPLRVSFPAEEPEAITEAFYQAFAPRASTNQQDLRVSIATMRYSPKQRRIETHLWNRHPLEENE
ncbi:MAG: hypothetical protein H6727_17140 [Myxococcales bacterium]|nr:hypothetical protein [Myxococcales bacterium]